MEPNKKLGKGCLSVLARAALIRLIVVFFVLGLAVFSCAIGLVIEGFSGNLWGLIAGTVVFLTVSLGGSFGWAFYTVHRRNLYLDKAFLPLGLKGSIFRIVFRRYTGQVHGKQVEVYFSRGPTVEILIQTNLKTRLGVSPAYGDTMFFSRLIDSQPLEHNVTNLTNLSIWAEEPEWARNVISEPSVQQALLRTVSSETFFVRRFLKFFPDFFQIHFSGNTNIFSWEIPPDLVHQWFLDAFCILQFAERVIPTPQNPIEMNSAERLALTIRRKDTTRITIILVVLMLILSVFVFVAAFLFISFFG